MTVTVQVRMKPAEYKRLHALARHHGRHASEIVRALIRDAHRLMTGEDTKEVPKPVEG